MFSQTHLTIAAGAKGRLTMDKNIVMFDKPYSEDKTAEGLGVNWALITGACNACKFLEQCSTDSNFQFPNYAPCMAKKSEILRGFNNG